MSGWDDVLAAYEAAHPRLTVLVEESRAEGLRAAIAEAGLPARVAVVASPFVPLGQMFLVNESERDRWLREVAVRGLL